jgi:SAM-dependent methyltransferase
MTTTTSVKRDSLMLFLSSILSLYVELLLIRYIAIEIHIFAYFKNLVLMSCFLGLGLGFAWTNHKTDWFRWSPLLFFGLSVVLSLALALGWNALTFVNPFQFMLFGIGKVGEHAPSIFDSFKCLAIMLGVFASSMFTFVGMGQYIGAIFEKMPPLKAYTINVAGALVGSAVFTLLCALQTPPGVWILVAGILYLSVQRRPAAFAIVLFGILHMTFLVPFIAGHLYGPEYVETRWSPYYRIDIVSSHPSNEKLKNLRWGYDLKVNYDTFQTILDCSPANLKNFPEAVQQKMLGMFSLPWDSLHIKPKDVLILASGNGCDVAAALRNGAERVDAVDIDPVLTDLGKTLHPEKPYLDPRVHLYVMDARTYLKNCTRKYDLILYAYLDSHTAFSSLSSLRTDNYVFTVDSYREAMHLLKPDGIIYVSFISFADFLWNRHTNALAEASGMTPVASYEFNGLTGVGNMAAGPGLKLLPPDTIKLPGTMKPVDTKSGVLLATDDWPFLYLPNRELSGTYVLPILMVLAFSALFVMRQLKTGLREPSNWLMMLMGMGFMLVEVRAMSDLSLMFGSTWIVNSCVISVVLVMILIGNVIAMKIQPDLRIVVGALLLTILASTLVKPDDLLSLGQNTGLLVACVLYLAPAAAAGVLFALLFKQVAKPSEALAFNIFGGLIGVSLEYLSMQFGVRFLGWLCLGIYLSTLLPMAAMKKSAPPAKVAD